MIAGTSICQEPADSARILFMQYKEYRDRGDFHQSGILLNRILDGGYRLSGYNKALVHNSLGFVYYETGEFKEALRHYQMAESFSGGTDSRSMSIRISIDNNLAMYHNAQGDHIGALDHYDRALRTLDSARLPREQSVDKRSMLLFNKGVVYYKLERWEDALRLLQESERIKERYGHRYLGSVYFNLARVYRKLGEQDQSEQYFHRSINRWIAEHDSGYYELANIYLYFGQFLADQGEDERGHDYLLKALQNYRVNYGERHPLTSACYEALAAHHLDRSDPLKALEFAQLALIAVTGTFHNTDISANPSLESSLHDLTLLKGLATKTRALEYLAKGSMEERIRSLQAALETNQLSIDLLRRIRESFPVRESRIFLTMEQKGLFSTGIRLNLRLFELTDKESFMEAAFLVASAGKSFELLYEMREKELLYLETLPDSLASLIPELKKQMGHYASLIQLENQKIRPDTARLSAWKDRLFAARLAYETQLDLLRQNHPLIAQFETIKPDFSVDRLQGSLGKKETLVEYFLSDPGPSGKRKLTVFAVTRSTCRAYQGIIDSTFYQDLEVVMRHIHEFDPFYPTPENTDSLRLALFNFYRQLIRPVEPYFRDKQLIIVPHEELFYLPFDALLERYEPETAMRYVAWPFLIRSYEISYLSNSQLIGRKRDPEIGIPRTLAWVPEYNGLGGVFPGRLKGASDEANKIMKITGGRMIREKADKKEAEKILEEDAILHLAMHTLPPRLSAGSAALLLSEEGDSLHEHRLHDYEINALALNSPLVVLSSCRSGGGRLEAGEGMMNLSRSFLLAGAESVVHAMWYVDDRRVSRLMQEFYREVKRGRSLSNALRRSKITFLTRTPATYAHPYYWSACQLTGDPSPVALLKIPLIISAVIVLLSLAAYFLIRRSFRLRS